MTSPEAAIRAKALSLGFDAVGISAPELALEARDGLADYLSKGYHGDMGWLAAKAERRGSPRVLWADAESVIMLAVNYGPDTNPLNRNERLKIEGRGNISVYAQNRDYHDVVKKRLKGLGRWMCDRFEFEVKVFVDTAPVMEKPLAERAGLGWQGKHTNLVSRDFGSWLFLGEIYTTLRLSPTPAEIDRCGSCRQCLEICPTNAFPAAHKLDARRCISYLTIEHKGHIPRDLRHGIGNRIYGCDDCLAVCPWNKFARGADEPAFLPRDGLDAPRLAELADLDDEAFRKLFSKSPIKRTGRDRFVRNVLIAIGNAGDADLAPKAEQHLDDPSPIVRAAAVWALGCLLEDESFLLLRERHENRETDPEVVTEWSAIHR